MSSTPHPDQLPVHELMPLPPHPIDPLFGEAIVESRYRFQFLLDAMIKHNIEMRVHQQSDLGSLYKAADRCNRTLWTTKETTPEGKVTILVRVRNAKDTASPFYRGEGINLAGRVVSRGRWRALALAAIADGQVEIDGPRKAAERVVWAAGLLARKYIREQAQRPKPREAYLIVPVTPTRWRVEIPPEARRKLMDAYHKETEPPKKE